jgi:hypothetical protein
MVIVTGVLLANNSRFGGTVLLQNLAYDIALSTREAQVYSISVVHFGDSFSTPFGVHYDVSSDDTRDEFIVFADVDGDGSFDPSNEYVQKTDITRGFYIGQLCVTPINGTQECNAQQVDIIFKHPEPDAYIRSSLNNWGTPYGSGRVKVMSPRNDELCIYTEFSGQISVRGCSSAL